MKRTLCRLSALAVLAALSALPAAGVAAQTVTAPRAASMFVGIVGQNRYIGEIASIDGPSGNPKGIMLQLGTDLVDIKLGPRYTSQPQSAEAEIEGLAVDDYAMVVARPIKGDLVAQRVQFDVEPFGRLKLMTGSVTWTSVNGRRFRLRLADTGVIRPLDIVRSTRYEMDGRPVLAPITVAKDETVQVLVVRANFDLYAADINIKSATAPSHFSHLS